MKAQIEIKNKNGVVRKHDYLAGNTSVSHYEDIAIYYTRQFGGIAYRLVINGNASTPWKTI